jgi:hypothetical protein
MNYKTPDNSLHFIDDANFLYLLPKGCVPITDEEAQALREIPEQTIQDKLNALDAENTITQRNLRETIMLMTEAFKTLSKGSLNLTTIPGVAKVYEVEAQAKTLRDEL